jgi:hypothetical protein
MSSDSPVAIIYDNTGEPMHSVEVNGEKHLGCAVVQDVTYSTNNSSTSNLAAGASFTGTADAVFAMAGVQVFCFSDKVISVSLQQSIDGSNWDANDTWLVYPDRGDGRSVQVVAKYIRVVAENLSPATTTSFRLLTILSPVADLMPRSLTENGTIRMSQQTMSAYPDPKNFTEISNLPALKSDWKGNLNIRGAVLTDESSFREDFTDGDITTSLSGTLTFTDSSYVAGTSTSFMSEVKVGDYIKLDSDGNSALTIVSDVISDTLLILEEAYNGTPGTGAASAANWYYVSGGGGTISYITSVLQLSSGAVPGGHSTITKAGDYLPFSLFAVVKISGRIANQETYIGFMETAAYLAEKIAAIKFDSTDNTKAKLVTSFNSDDIETTTFTLPNGGITDDYHSYRLEVNNIAVSLWVDNIKVASHQSHILGPYDEVDIACGIANMGVVSGSNTLSVDVLSFNNFNRIDTAITPVGEPLPVSQYKPLQSTATSVSAAVADTQLLAVNTSRTGATVYNDSTAILYLKLGTGASASSFTARLGARDYYETPYGYSGAIHGYWASATGNARITEVF